jgi:hypothetical protein
LLQTLRTCSSANRQAGENVSGVTRRSALLGGVGALASAGTVLALRDAGPARSGAARALPTAGGLLRPPAHLVPLLRSHYTAAIGAPVLARQHAHAHRLRLVSIHDLQDARVAERQFNLLFEQLGTGTVEEGIYHLSGTRIPDSTLFLSPVGMAGPQRRLQALINSPT